MDMEQTSKASAALVALGSMAQWREFEEQRMAQVKQRLIAHQPGSPVATYWPFPSRSKPDLLAAMTRCASHPTQAVIKATWVEPVSTAKPFVAGLMRVKA